MNKLLNILSEGIVTLIDKLKIDQLLKKILTYYITEIFIRN
jgi:hypothetical protein